MAPLLKWARGLMRRVPLTPLQFPTAGFEAIPATHLLQEETLDEFKTGNYYPVNIGDLFAADKYQVVGKLGFVNVDGLARPESPVCTSFSDNY
jgi:hypothetical protein